MLGTFANLATFSNIENIQKNRPLAPHRVRCISPILFKVGVPNLVCVNASWDGGVLHTIFGHCDLDLDL